MLSGGFIEQWVQTEVHEKVTAGILLAMSCTGGCDLCGDNAKRFDAQDKPQVAAIYHPSADLL